MLTCCVCSDLGPRTPSIRPRDILEQAIEDVELSWETAGDVHVELMSFVKQDRRQFGAKGQEKEAIVGSSGGGDSVNVEAHSCCVRPKVSQESPLMYLFCTIAAN